MVPERRIYGGAIARIMIGVFIASIFLGLLCFYRKHSEKVRRLVGEDQAVREDGHAISSAAHQHRGVVKIEHGITKTRGNDVPAAVASPVHTIAG
jgi:hypothetical protein